MENNETAISFDEKVEKMKKMAEVHIKKNGTVGSIKLLKKSINQLAKCKPLISTTLQFELSSMQNVVKKSNFNMN